MRENVAYGMEIKRWDKKLIEDKLDAILPLVGLADTAELYPNQVSASMVRASPWPAPSPSSRICS